MISAAIKIFENGLESRMYALDIDTLGAQRTVFSKKIPASLHDATTTYHVLLYDQVGNFLESEMMLLTGVDEITLGGTQVEVIQQFPNPFVNAVSILFTLKKSTKLSLKIFDSIGKEIAELSSATFSQGDHIVDWNPTNIPSGVYFLQLKTENGKLMKKIIKI